MKSKEISNYDLVYPLITQTAPPPLSYYGSIGDYDYFSSYYRKYRVLKSNMRDEYKFNFVSWNKKNKVAMTIKILELIPKDKYNLEDQKDDCIVSDIDEQGRPTGGFRP